jgi:guanyl-specific ribonuclease Sa
MQRSAAVRWGKESGEKLMTESRRLDRRVHQQAAQESETEQESEKTSESDLNLAVQGAITQPGLLSPRQVIHLQRTIGNRAVIGLLSRMPIHHTPAGSRHVQRVISAPKAQELAQAIFAQWPILRQGDVASKAKKLERDAPATGKYGYDDSTDRETIKTAYTTVQAANPAVVAAAQDAAQLKAANDGNLAALTERGRLPNAARGQNGSAHLRIAEAALSTFAGEEYEALVEVLDGIANSNTRPYTGGRWNVDHQNREGLLPGTPGAGGYKEYYVRPDGASKPAAFGDPGTRRLVTGGGFYYYTKNHYGDNQPGAYVPYISPVNENRAVTKYGPAFTRITGIDYRQPVAAAPVAAAVT